MHSEENSYGLGICAISTITVGPQSDTEATSDSDHDASDSAHGEAAVQVALVTLAMTQPVVQVALLATLAMTQSLAQAMLLLAQTHSTDVPLGTGEYGCREAGYNRGKIGYSASSSP